MDFSNLIIMTEVQIPFYISIFIIGSIVGSFIATLVIRWPKTQSIIYGRSSCDQCGHKLQVRDLIPLISYSLQHGKCRYCNGSIDPLHWHIELMVAALSILAFILFPVQQAAGLMIWLWLFIPLAILDYKYLWLPNRLIIITIIAAPVIGPLMNDVSIVSRLIGAMIGYLFLETLRIAFKKLRNKEAMGGGDPSLVV